MPLIGSITKQPRAKKLVTIDYDDFLYARTVDGAPTVTIEPQVGITVSSSLVSADKRYLNIWVEGGTTGNGYRIVVLYAVLIGGKPETDESEIDIVVVETPNTI